MSYSADGRAQVSRDGMPTAVTISLEPRRATLRPGERVTYDVVFWN